MARHPGRLASDRRRCLSSGALNEKTESQCLRSSPDATELAVVLGPVKEWPENVVRAEPLRQRPSLTAPARDGPKNPRVGTEGWAPQGPNKRMISAEVRIGGTKKAKEVLVVTSLPKFGSVEQRKQERGACGHVFCS
jgi:hypothetical protein